jgi:ketosteroid isomerase-like protein
MCPQADTRRDSNETRYFSSMSPENLEGQRQAFNEALAALSRGDVDGFVEYVAPHPDWQAVEELRPFEDREEVRRYTEEWLDHWNAFSLEAEAFQQVADGWLVTVHASGQSRDGIEIDDHFYLDVAIRGGQIIRWREYSERSTALEALGRSE